MQTQLHFQHEANELVETQQRMWHGCNARTSQATQQVAGLAQELTCCMQKLEGTVSGLQDDVRVLQRGMQEVKSSVRDLQSDVGAMKAGMQQFKGIVGGLRGHAATSGSCKATCSSSRALSAACRMTCSK